MPTFLLTWNGDPSSFDDPTFEELVEATRRGVHVPGLWSLGNRRSGTNTGDVVYLLMQGRIRGVIGSGVLTSSVVETRSHWRDPSRDAAYAPVVWRTVLPMEYRLTTEFLEQAIPEFNWRMVLASGQRVPSVVAESLDRLWEERVEEASSDHGTLVGTEEIYAWLRRNKANVAHVLDDAIVGIRSVFGPDVQMRLVQTFVASQAEPRVARIEILSPPDSDAGWDGLIRVNQLLIAHQEQLQRQSSATEPLLSVQLVLADSDPSDWAWRADESHDDADD